MRWPRWSTTSKTQGAVRTRWFLCFALAALVGLTTSAASAADDSTFAEVERTARAHPNSAEAWNHYGEALARERRFVEAQQAFAKALRHAPRDKNILYHAALAYAWSGDYAEAARRYRELLARYPQDHTIRIDYGQVLAWDRKFAEARAQYGLVLKFRPRHVEALRHLGMLTAWEVQYEEALRLLDQALAVEPRNPDLLADRGEVLSWKGDLPAAAKSYEQALLVTPKRAALLLKLAHVYAWQGRTRPARETYEKVIALDPQNVDARIGLARVYLDNHQFRDAERILSESLARFPDDPRLGKELTALAAGKRLSIQDVVERLEPLLFIVILLVLARHIWRYRRILRRRHVGLTILLAALPGLATLTALVYGFVLLGGAYYREIETASKLLEALVLIILAAVFFTLVWLLRFERPTRMQTVLAIGAHPDDIEFGCGATLLRLREEGCRTYGIILTGGERGFANGDGPGRRLEEARAAALVIALTDITVLDLPDTGLHEHKEAIRAAIEQAIARWQPDIIFTHNAHDVHTDHKTVHDATREAARGACTILCYENPNTPPGYNPDYFFDVSGYLEDKIAALARHQTQMGKAYADPAVIRAAAAFRGNQARVKFAEAFEVVRVLDKAPAV